MTGHTSSHNPRGPLAPADPGQIDAKAVAGFLNPNSVAIVGVSARDHGEFRAGGRAVLDHLMGYGYRGQVWPVHRTADTIAGVPAYPDLGALPGVPDCVVVAVPAPEVAEVIRQCASAGARRALVLTGGFRELGPEGSALEAEVLSVAADTKVRLVGPNSTGLVNVGGNVALSMTSVLTAGAPLVAGSLAILTQSGAIGSSLVERARDAGIGVSHLVSIGNQSDLTAADFLAHFALDDSVRAVALYLESIPHGPALAHAVSMLHSAGKQAVALLGGRSAAGEVAAASHTGKIAGRGALETSLLRSLGLMVAEDLDDLWIIGSALSSHRPPRTVARWGVLTYSGGMGVLAVDQLMEAGAQLATLSASTIARMREHLPSYVSASNPLDMGPGAMPHGFADLLACMLDDDGVDGVCIPMPMGAAGWHQPIIDAVKQARPDKSLLVGWYGGEAVRPYVNTLLSTGVIAVSSPTELGRLARALTEPGTGLRVPPGTRHDRPAVTIGGHRALQLLGDAGLDVTRMQLCEGEDAVRHAARQLQAPLVLKSAAEDIAHRAELGLVRAGLETPDEAADAYRAMAAGHRVGDTVPFRVIAQEMVLQGRELVLVVRDAGALGWFGGVGLGGVAVEVFADLAFVPLPCTFEVFRSCLQRLRSWALWSGHRGAEPIDLGWVHSTLLRLADTGEANGWSEIEVNPAFVSGETGTIVDGLITPRE